MSLLSRMCALVGVVCCGLLATTTNAATESPVGRWEAAISGADKGIGYFEFHADGSLEGYAITQASYDVAIFAGSWSIVGPKFVGSYTETIGGNVLNGSFSGTAKANRSISGSGAASNGTFSFKGTPVVALRNIAGNYGGTVKQHGVTSTTRLTVTATEYPGLYAVNGWVNFGSFIDVSGYIVMNKKSGVVLCLENDMGGVSSVWGTIKASGYSSLKGKQYDDGSSIAVKVSRV